MYGAPSIGMDVSRLPRVLAWGSAPANNGDAMPEPTDIDVEGETDKRVCHACVGEPLLKAEIKRLGRPAECAYCDNTRLRTVGVTWLARRIDDVYRQMVRFAEEQVRFNFEDGAVWAASGETPSELIAELISAADTTIAADIVDQLGSDHAYDIHRDGDTDWYDETTDTYELDMPDDPQFRDAWLSFCESVKHSRRFFSEDAAAVLDMILGPILEQRKRTFRAAIRTIGPDDEGRYVYRARQANDEARRHRIYAAPIAELSAPPVTVATAGRMNPTGISVFYGSRDAETAVAELRVPVGGAAVVGRFEIIRPLRLLDLTRLEQIENDLSPFHPDYFETYSHAKFLRGFHREIRKPVVPGRESLEYLPTQVVAEYLWTHKEHAVDGVIFGSAQVSGGRENIVLFPRACLVENAAQEVRRHVSRSHAYRATEDDEDATEFVYLRPLPEPPPAAPAGPAFPDLDWLTAFDRETEPEPEPSLRLDVGTLSHACVEAIRYRLEELPVRLEEDRFGGADDPF